ncbi:GrpB family protein [Ureibacillus sp. GCM10028918]|uniref:GrpB family protein n=1 Tax=Ureibacillus sp. GCM10028918 TaxID=3273429 RepID=UPI00360D1F2D
MKESIVKLSDYNPEWKIQFEDEKRKILEALGAKVVEIEHIGSTSIKGLKAKPIIDIMCGVQDLGEVSYLVNPLRNIEYEYVPKPEFKDRRFFRKGACGQGTSHLHICEWNSSEWIEKILFRDYLRLYPQAAEKYASLKEALASKFQFDRPNYTKNKEPFIRTIIEQAKKDISTNILAESPKYLI